MGAELIGLGLATLDHLVLVESFQDSVADLRVKGFRVEGGGPAASALVAASRMGLETELWSVVGRGPLAGQIVAGLRAEGVALDRLRVREDVDGPLILVFVDSTTGERRFQGGVLWRSDGPYPLDLGALDTAKCLLVDGTWPRAALEAARYAHQRRLPVVADFGSIEGHYREVIPHTDYLIVDEACATRLAGGDHPERACELLLAMGPRVAAVTLGPRGCVYADSARVRRLPAFRVEVVDTTGAGDCFHGAFCVGVVRGWDLDRSMEFASAAAALCCRELGGRAGVPGLAEVEAFRRGTRR
jgi:sugar/nucleoside kinase (ribokinase family)